MGLWRFNELLAEQGLALTNMGDIQAQTVSGAIGTGTHGTGRASASIAAQVAGFELVLADGSIVTCSATERRVVRGGAHRRRRDRRDHRGDLPHEPAFLLAAREEPMHLDAVLDSFDELWPDNEHFEFWWFPHTDAHEVKRNNRTAGPAAPLSRSRVWLEDEFLSNTFFGRLRAGRSAPRAMPASTPARHCRRAATPTARTRCSPRRGASSSWRWSTRSRATAFVPAFARSRR